MAQPSDGRLTSLTTLASTLAGTELMYIVSPGTAAQGVSYNITLDSLAAFFAAFPALNTAVVTSGATYNVQSTDTKVLIDKTLGSATSVVFPTSLQYGQTVLIKDLKGDAATNNITITFSGGQLCDGLSSIVINNDYGFVYITPTPAGTAWYMS